METRVNGKRELEDEVNRTNQWLEMIEENTRGIKSTMNIILGIILFGIVFSILAGIATLLFGESIMNSIPN